MQPQAPQRFSRPKSSAEQLRSESAAGWEPLRVAKRGGSPNASRRPVSHNPNPSDSESGSYYSQPSDASDGPRRTSNSFKQLERNLVTNSVFRQASDHSQPRPPTTKAPSPEPPAELPSKPKPRPSSGYNLVQKGHYVTGSKFRLDQTSNRVSTPSLTDESGSPELDSYSPPHADCDDHDGTSELGNTRLYPLAPRARHDSDSSDSISPPSRSATPRGRSMHQTSPASTPKGPHFMISGSPPRSMSPSPQKRTAGPRQNGSGPTTHPHPALTVRSRKKSVTWAPSEEVHEFDALTSEDGDSRRGSGNSFQSLDNSFEEEEKEEEDDQAHEEIVQNIVSASGALENDDMYYERSFSKQKSPPPQSARHHQNNTYDLGRDEIEPDRQTDAVEGRVSPLSLAKQNLSRHSSPGSPPRGRSPTREGPDDSIASIQTNSTADSNSPLSHQLRRLEVEQSASTDKFLYTENEAAQDPFESNMATTRNVLKDSNPDTSTAADVFGTVTSPMSDDSVGRRPLPPTPLELPNRSSPPASADSPQSDEKELHIKRANRQRVKSMYSSASRPMDGPANEPLDSRPKTPPARPLTKSDSEFSLTDVDIGSTSMLLEELGLERTASLKKRPTDGREESIRRTDKRSTLKDDGAENVQDDFGRAPQSPSRFNRNVSPSRRGRESPTRSAIEEASLGKTRSPLEELANGFTPSPNEVGEQSFGKNSTNSRKSRSTKQRSYSTGDTFSTPQKNQNDTSDNSIKRRFVAEGNKNSASTPFGNDLHKELDLVYDNRDRSYRAHEHEVVYLGSSTKNDSADTRPWRKIKGEEELEDYSEDVENLLKGDTRYFADGKAFFKICKINLEDIPIPSIRTMFQLVLDNGTERVSSRYEWEVAREVANLGPEYEVMTNPRLQEVTFSLHARLDSHLRPQAAQMTPSKSKSGLRKLFGSSPKKLSGQAQLDPLAALLGPNGLIGRVTLPFSEVVRLCTGRIELLAIPLHSNTDSKIGSMRVKVFRIPPLPEAFAPSIPQDLDGCIKGLQLAKWHCKESRLGTLTQMGGDCPTWRRRQFKVIGTQMVAYNMVTKSPVAIIELDRAISVEDKQSGPHLLTPRKPAAGQQAMMANQGSNRKVLLDDEREPYNVEREFCLLFADDEEISFFADSEAEKAAWLECLQQLVGKAPPKAPWAQFIKALEYRQKGEQLKKQAQGQNLNGSANQSRRKPPPSISADTNSVS